VKRALFLFSATALVACGNNSRMGAQFHKPVAMAVFKGFTHVHLGRVSSSTGQPDPSPYLAVVNSTGDELRIVDLADNKVVPSPGMAFPLSVTTDPLPLKIASAWLGDDLADLLVVVSAGELGLQVARTWDSANGKLEIERPVGENKPTIDFSTELGGAAAGTSVLSLIGIPGSKDAADPTHGKARVLVGLTGGRLAVVDFTRSTDGTGAIDLANVSIQVKTLGFDPVDLALAQDASMPNTDYRDTSTIYAATPDLITDSISSFQAFGVAAITTTADPTQAWPIRALKAGPASSAGAPTRLVAAATLAERRADLSDPEHFGPAARRVYAVLDESQSTGSGGQLWGCGLSNDISCGIVTIDPTLDPTTGRATSLAADPANGFQPAGGVAAQTYRAPFVLSATPLAIAITLPPSNGPQRCVPPRIGGSDPNAPNCPLDGSGSDLLHADQAGAGAAFLPLAASSGQRWTTAAMVVAAGDGNPYVIDLGRMAATDDVSLLNDNNTRTKVSSAVSLLTSGTQPSASAPGLGLHTDVTGSSATDVTIDSAALPGAIWVTPGYTTSATWTVTYHGALPGLVNRTAMVATDGSGTWVALQSPGSPPQSLGDIVDPALGAQVGDYVDVVLPGGQECANSPNSNGQGQGRGQVVARLPPDTARPGGALRIIAVPGGDSELSDGLGGDCALPPTGTAWPAVITVRTSGLVLVRAGTGYAGRPSFDIAYPFGWQEEAPLVAACPDSPETAHRAAWFTNQSQCESLAIARGARRFFYPEEQCATGQACQTNNWYPNFIDGNALTTGPAVELRVGHHPASTTPTIGSYVAFNTLSGLTPMARGPVSPTVPSFALAYDRTRVPTDLNSSSPSDVPVFYVTYVSDEVVSIPPGSSAAGVFTMR
jgi:hypothetical protein